MILRGCTPRKEVLHGDLDDAIFAADFGSLIAGDRCPEVYRDPGVFFENTHPAAQLKKVVEVVFGRLADPKEAGTMVRLSTGFGGGKTHTLMSLWHLAKNIKDHKLGTDLLPAAGRPKDVTIVAIDAGKAGVPVFSVQGRTQIHSLWGEIFYQLGGDAALKTLGKADDPEGSPADKQIGQVLPKGPVLFLLDELVIYMAKLSDRGQGNLLGFINSLAAVAAARPQTVLVVTDPAGQTAYAAESAQLGSSLNSAAARLDDVLGRRASDFDPVGDESAKVIVRRLFQSVDLAAAETVSAKYFDLYQRVNRDWPGHLPAHATSADYAKRIRECFPFHPRLLDTTTDRLGALQEFNKSRGTLRLFARILRTIWESKLDIDLITAGDLDWSSPRIQADLLQRLNRDNFKAAISADIEKHAGELDGDMPRGVHRRVASALLLESIPMQSNSGLDPAELTLAVLRPDEAGNEPTEALDHLVGVCWHSYPMAGGRGWQFRYEPNIIKQVEERIADIPFEDGKSRVCAEVQQYFQGPEFKLAAWPARASQVPNSSELQLALCEEEKLAKRVCQFEDDSDENALMPRGFQNAILAITATPSALNHAIDRARRLLASEGIERDHKTGDSSKLVREQLAKLRPEFTKQFRLQAYRAFDRVIFGSGQVLSLDESYQVSEEQMLARPQGQSGLRKFLNAKGLIYQAGDALDLHRFLKDVLPGAVPLAGKPGVYTARAIYDRFLSAQGLRLVPDASIARQTLIRAVAESKLVLRTADGRAYDDRGMVSGREGQRHRSPATITSFAMDDTVEVALPSSDSAREWLRQDQPKTAGEPDRQPVAPPPSRATATTWESIQTLAADRALLELRLKAITPAAAQTFAALAQPLGADALALTITLSGDFKDGGNMNLVFNDVKLNHATRPLATTQTLFNALREGSLFEAELTLTFGPEGRAGLASALASLAESAADGITPWAQFDKPPQ
ncbi:MAG: ATP-binding protein [Betaproteobacteria bacterium]|nr:MAG: ATP-binding protein [Betaproteobacteria bacterium]